MDEIKPDRHMWPAGFGAWIKLGVVYQRASRQLAESLRSLDITVAQFDALANLFVGDRISQQQLAQRLLVTKGNVSGLVKRLVERQLISQLDDPEDRRAKLICLTDSGREVAERGLVLQRGLVDQMMCALPYSEQEQLRTSLDKMIVQLDEQALSGDCAAQKKALGRSPGQRK